MDSQADRKKQYTPDHSIQGHKNGKLHALGYNVHLHLIIIGSMCANDKNH